METPRLASTAIRLTTAIAFLLMFGIARPVLAEEVQPPVAVEEGQAQVESGPPPDLLAPVVTEPPDLLVAAIDVSGAVVEFVLPGAVDDVDGPVAVVCDWGTGALFPLGTSVVTCRAGDLAGNVAVVDFLVTVSDQTPPVITWPADIYVTAPDSSGAVVSFAVPSASDNVDGASAVSCSTAPGSFFPVGTSVVTCWSSDAAGNAASAVSFNVVVEAPPPPPPVPTAVPTDVPVQPTAIPVEPTPATTDAPAQGGVGGADTSNPGAPPLETGAGQETNAVATSVATVAPTVEPTPTSTPEPASTDTVATVVPAPLPLPWPPPGNFVINYGGGPLNGIDLIWGYEDFPVSQEFGHTEFSILNHSWYTYGIAYGLDGFAHPGLDVGMPAGTWLYSPVDGTVRIAGGVPGYTYYGNWEPGVGQLLIETDDGHEIVLGHMGRISVGVGERVSVGQFVGLSGGFNGDHLHLEVREVQTGGWLLAVDPRESVLVTHIEAATQPEDVADPAHVPPPPAETASDPGPYASVEARVPDLTPLSQAVLVERQIASLANVLPPPSDGEG